MNQPYNYGPPMPPPPPPKKRRTGLIVLGVIGAVVFVMFAGCVAMVASVGSGTSTSPDAAPDQSAEGKSTAKPPGVGDKVTDGNLTFTVTGVDTAQSIGEGILATEAQGKYVIVALTVRNTGDEAATFNAGPSQIAYDKAGREFETSQDALMSGDAEDMNAFLEQINPGSKVKGRLVYDVPEDTELVRVHLQGGTFTSGVEVRLS